MMGPVLKIAGFCLLGFHLGWKIALAVLLIELGHQIDGHAQHSDKVLKPSRSGWGKEYVERWERN